MTGILINDKQNMIEKKSILTNQTNFQGWKLIYRTNKCEVKQNIKPYQII